MKMCLIFKEKQVKIVFKMFHFIYAKHNFTKTFVDQLLSPVLTKQKGEVFYVSRQAVVYFSVCPQNRRPTRGKHAVKQWCCDLHEFEGLLRWDSKQNDRMNFTVAFLKNISH